MNSNMLQTGDFILLKKRYSCEMNPSTTESNGPQGGTDTTHYVMRKTTGRETPFKITKQTPGEGHIFDNPVALNPIE